MVLEIVFVVCMILAFFGATPIAEPYRAYASFPLWVAVLCLGLRVFSLVHG